ncbi:MAG: (2Fe-2S)-binding protein [Planctomycetota bacterium]|nr:(2Fe-2S)-binding protein [Planctomycetota bacterium]
MAVDRCTCHGVTFADLKRIAEMTNADFEQLVKKTNCGAGCGLCLPYIRVMLRTGRTELPILTPDEYRKLIGSGT